MRRGCVLHFHRESQVWRTRCRRWRCMPENSELLNDLKFENGSSSGSGDLSQKRRSDCNRNLSNHPEHNKLKICRDNHPQRSSQHVENQVMVKSPSCWTLLSSETRQTTHNKIQKNSEPLSRDVIELKQAALWYGTKFVLIKLVSLPQKVW